MPRVLVTHPCKQYSHHLVYALQDAGYLTKFITSFWYKPGVFPFTLLKYLPASIKVRVLQEFKKKSFSKIDNEFVEQFPYIEAARELIERKSNFKYKSDLMYYRNKMHDYYVSKRLNKYKPEIVIGYETSSKLTFKKAKLKGAVNILDLAQVHFNYSQSELNKYTDEYLDNKLLESVNRYKEEEINLTDYFLVLSDFAKDTLIDNKVPESKIYKVNLGYNKNIFSQKKNYRKNGKFKILYVGSIAKRKGIDMLLKVSEELRNSNIELTVIGSVSDASDVFNSYTRFFTHIDFSSQEDLTKYYQDADLFVFPSYLDSWAMVVIEAMASGTPVIVSENTGSKELVKNNENGFVIRTGDSEMLKEKILYFYDNRFLLESYGNNASESVKDHGWDDYYKNIINVIDNIYSRENGH